MPSEVLMARYEGHHGLHPVRVLDACSSTLEGLLDVVEPIPALQGVASMANGARDVDQLAACYTLTGRQVVGWTRHLRGSAQAPGYESCFFL